MTYLAIKHGVRMTPSENAVVQLFILVRPSVGLRDEVPDSHDVQNLATEALGRETGADTLARRVDCRRPPPARRREPKALIFSASRAPAAVSNLARICSSIMRPSPNGSPLSSTVGTAMTWRASVPSLSMATCLTRGLSATRVFRDFRPSPAPSTVERRFRDCRGLWDRWHEPRRSFFVRSLSFALGACFGKWDDPRLGSHERWTVRMTA